MASRELKVEIIGDASSLSRALGKAGDASTGFGSKFAKAGKVIGVAALGMGAAVGAGLFVTLKRGFDELADSQKVLAQTQAVLKSTGGAANITAQGVDDLATSLSHMSGVDDEVIASGENMLLTFKNIRNETGKGNDIFNQTTATLLDMSTALGTDMNKSAIQLGKALNDPIKGITALTRVGVTFTEGQRETIKAMVESGDTMGAQKLILKELNSEFGGSAKAFGETMPGQLAKLKNAFDEVAGEMATKFLPILTSIVTWVNEHWTDIAAVFDAVGTAIVASFDAIGTAVEFLRGQWAIHRESAIKAWNAVQAAVVGFINWFNTNVVPPIQSVISAAQSIWHNFGGEIKTVLNLIVVAIKTFVQNAFAPIKIALDLLRGDWSAAWDELKGVVSRTLGAIVTIITGLTGSIISAALQIGKGIVTAILGELKDIGGKFKGALIDPVVNALKGAITAVGNAALEVARAIIEPFTHLPSFLGAPFRAAKDEINKQLGVIEKEGGATASAAGYTIGSFMATGVSAGIAAAAYRALETARQFVADIAATLKQASGAHSPARITIPIGESLAEGIVVGFAKTSNKLIPGMGKDVADAFSGISSTVKTNLDAAIGSFGDFDTAKDATRDNVLGLGTDAGTTFKSIATSAEDHFPDAEAAMHPFGDYLSELRGKFEGVAAWAYEAAGAVKVFSEANTGNVTAGLPLPEFATGGIVTKPTLALIGEKGPEAVVPLSGTRRHMGGNLTVNVYGSVTSERDLVTSIRNALVQEGRRSGGGLIGGYA